MRTNKLDSFVRAVIGMDTRLIEIAFAVLCMVKGTLVILYPVPPPMMPLALHALHVTGLPDAWLVGVIMLSVGTGMLLSTAQGMINNNHYKQRSIWAAIICVGFGMRCVASFYGGAPQALPYSVIGLGLSMFTCTLIGMKGEAVRLGCISIRGSIAVIPRLEKRRHVVPVAVQRRHE